MAFIDRALEVFGLARQKFVEYPTISGGMGGVSGNIFSGLFSWDWWTSGKRMETYSKSLYVFACVSRIAVKVASIEWQLFRITNAQGDKKEVFAHAALDIIYKPNPFQTKEEFWQRFIINKKLAGTAFILKVRNAGGKVVEMWNLRPDLMRIVFDDKGGDIKAYEFSGPGGKQIMFKPEDIIRDSYPDPMQEFGGISPLQPAQSRIDVEEYATKYQKNFFINNARPDFVFVTEKRMSPEQKEELHEAWEDRLKAGRKQENVGKGGILEGGLKYQQVSISQREMDFIESMKFTRDDILVAFGVPKPIVAITEDVNYANANTAMAIFLSETIVPEVRQIATKLNEEMIYDDFDQRLYLDFENPVPENKTEKATIQAQRITAGSMLINEARAEWGDDPIRGGDTLYMPIGLTPMGGSASIGKLADVRRRIFRGRPKALELITVKDRVKKKMMELLADQIDKDAGEAEKKKRPLITTEIRKAYGDMVLKSIDKRGEAMKGPLNGFFEKQHKRLMKAIRLTKGEKFSAGNWRAAAKKWAEKEEVLTATFVLPYIQEFLKEAGEQAMQTVAPARDFDAEVARIQTYIKNKAKQTGKETTATTLEYVSREIAEGIVNDEGTVEIAKRIGDVFQEFPDYRSAMIARTEATSANNRGFVESYQQSGVANAKEWIATNDDRTRDSHIQTDGEIVGLEEEFTNGLEYPGDPKGDPSETVNCRCVLGPAFQEL